MSSGPGPVDNVELINVFVHEHFVHARKTDIASSPAGAVAASRTVVSGDVHAFLGWALTETTGAAAAAVRFRDGLNANAEIIARINLAANESDRDVFPPFGIECNTGSVWLEVISGSVEGVIYWR